MSEERLRELRLRYAAARRGGGEGRGARQHAAGKRPAIIKRMIEEKQ